ncbi:hypothetical protein PENSTE_c022G04430 [Penicillium steckii]|uniref:Uncharacterized protein n=1 Tax=Penicillium steckii TaxID=303698 RepID=A0A1V6SSJ4_9EURO|nr:hypothetical protein PENSTE_c053G02979 [Penicillium steckii]OQE16986.1 hypothetical protein PENSTE_c022G04430 [Penicillium steckii]
MLYPTIASPVIGRLVARMPSVSIFATHPHISSCLELLWIDFFNHLMVLYMIPPYRQLNRTRLYKGSMVGAETKRNLIELGKNSKKLLIRSSNSGLEQRIILPLGIHFAAR